MTRLSEKIALVTASSRGIGRAIAKRLAEDGVLVIINYAVNVEAANALVAEIAAAGGEAIAIQAKLGSAPETDKLFSRFESELKDRPQPARLDVLVNNAGIGHFGKVSDATEPLNGNSGGRMTKSGAQNTAPASRLDDDGLSRRRALKLAALPAAVLGGPRANAAADARPSNLPSRSLVIEGFRQNVIDVGADPAVLMLHGFPNSSADWRHQIPEFVSGISRHRARPPRIGKIGQSAYPGKLHHRQRRRAGACVVVRAEHPARSRRWSRSWRGSGMVYRGALPGTSRAACRYNCRSSKWR